ncbi:MAG: RecB family exonuclease [Methanobacteriota archaeon]
MLPLSYTSASAYSHCPLRWKFLYVDGLEPEPRPGWSYGKSVHAALEYFYKCPTPPPPLPDLLSFYESVWDRAGFVSAGQERGAFSAGRNVLVGFHERHATAFRAPLAVEQGFELSLGKVGVVGFIDRIDALPGGGVEIVDYKSGRRPPKPETVAASDQFGIYQLACERVFGHRVEALSVYHLGTHQKVSVPAHPAARLEALEARLLDVAGRIEAKEFPPRLSAGCPCEFASRCPYYAGLSRVRRGWFDRHARTESETAVEAYATNGDPAAAIVIRDYARAEGLLRLWGPTHAVRLDADTLVVEPREDLRLPKTSIRQQSL